jgi:hypothetical protein
MNQIVENKEMSFLSREKNDLDNYSEATVPTPADQEDVSPIDMVSDAVEEVMDNVRDGMGLSDESLNDDK